MLRASTNRLLYRAFFVFFNSYQKNIDFDKGFLHFYLVWRSEMLFLARALQKVKIKVLVSHVFLTFTCPKCDTVAHWFCKLWFRWVFGEAYRPKCGGIQQHMPLRGPARGMSRFPVWVFWPPSYIYIYIYIYIRIHFGSSAYWVWIAYSFRI